MSQPLRLLDRSAIGLSALCLVHCLALPALALVIPLVGELAHADWVHGAFLGLAAPVSAAALWRSGAWRSPLICGLGAGGLSLLGAGALLASHEALETMMTVAGGLLLATCHLLNQRHSPQHGAAG